MVMKEPGLMLLVPSVAFTIPPAPGAITGRVFGPEAVSEITLSPDSVMAYAVVPAESTTIWRGLVLKRVVPKTFTGGFSGTTPASVSAPVVRSTISSVVRGSSRVVVVMLCRTGVVRRRNVVELRAVAAATFRWPVLTTVVIGGPPGNGVGTVVVLPGCAEPPTTVSEGFKISPSERKYEPEGPVPITP